MRVPSSRQELIAIFCWLYALLGACCLAAGIYLFYANHLLGKPPYQSMGPIAFILALFGLVRIANSARVLNNIRRRTRSGL